MFIDEHKERFGVEPIRRVLSEHGCKISPSTYYAARSRALSARAVRDERSWSRSVGSTRPRVEVLVLRRARCA